jgi:LysR family transcriptional regulator, regulator for bpeEF and oprC
LVNNFSGFPYNQSMDRLRAMQVFSLVAELGSFSKAADALNLPNATVSTLVAQLEAHLQAKLLARTTRRIALTEDGSAYLERIRRLLTELADIEDALAGQTRAPQGRVRVDVPAAAGRHVLAPALPDFCARYPGITVEIGSTDRPVDLIAEGVDCVIRGGAVHDETLVAKPLGEFETITCAAPSYLARAGEPRTLDDFAQHTAVNFFSAKTGRAASSRGQRCRYAYCLGCGGPGADSSAAYRRGDGADQRRPATPGFEPLPGRHTAAVFALPA